MVTNNEALELVMLKWVLK